MPVNFSSKWRTLLAILFFWFCDDSLVAAQIIRDSVVYDTLSLKHMRDYNNFSYQAFKIDSIQIELVHKNKRLAILPNYLNKEINEEQIGSTEFLVEKWGNGKIILRIIMKLID